MGSGLSREKYLVFKFEGNAELVSIFHLGKAMIYVQEHRHSHSHAAEAIAMLGVRLLYGPRRTNAGLSSLTD